MEIEKEKLLDMYLTMVRIRAFEERVAKEYAAGKIGGIVHLYLGEEAIATGACANLRPDDYIVSTHRGHGHLIAKGGKTDRMMAEVFGRNIPWIISSALAKKDLNFSLMPLEEAVLLHMNDARMEAGLPIIRVK